MFFILLNLYNISILNKNLYYREANVISYLKKKLFKNNKLIKVKNFKSGILYFKGTVLKNRYFNFYKWARVNMSFINIFNYTLSTKMTIFNKILKKKKNVLNNDFS